MESRVNSYNHTSLRFSDSDKVLILAPHPDDEALGTGGLIQQTVAAGVGVRVIFVTDGDNNPWPQRYVERRWFINEDCRKRWGIIRRLEAVRSLETLGLTASDAHFMGLPDAGVLSLWKRRDASVLEAFVNIFKEWPPSHLIVPSPADRHADHRGTFGFTQEALNLTGQKPAQYSYLIHRGFFRSHRTGSILQLTKTQMETKLQAILCHETQMHLSRGRFTGYARPVEVFTPEPLPDRPVNTP